MNTRKHISVGILSLAVLLVLPARAEMSESDRMARCANNQARIAELEPQLGEVPLSDDQVRDANRTLDLGRDNVHRAMSALASSNYPEAESSTGMALGTLGRLAASLHVDAHDCRIWNDHATISMRVQYRARVAEGCLFSLTDALSRLTADAPEKRARRAALEMQIARYRTNLIALRCDEPARAQGAGTSNSTTGWQAAGAGDCPGKDEASSSGQRPDPGMCTAARAGKAAVCWDGDRYKNHYGETHGAPAYPWCTYKSTGSCGGGENTGSLYICRP